MEPLIVLIEDEQQIRRFLRVSLPEQGFQLIEASTGNAGIERVLANKPDLILLDLGLPDIDGLKIIQIIREKSMAPIIILSARGQESDKIQALNNGADDYVTKPFTIGELIARIRAALRRAKVSNDPSAEATFTSGDLSIDYDSRVVKRLDAEVRLTPIEYELLTVLTRHAGKVLTHKQLLKMVWGDEDSKENHYLRVYMAQLRQKLELDSARPRHLITEPGIGYRFKL